MSVIDEVKQRTDIVDVVSQYVSLKKAGRNLVGLCPFHSERHPSFFVYPEQQSWHCFGCNTGGDVLSFVMKKESLDFGEALRLLAQRAGVTIPSKFEREEGKEEKERLYKVNEVAAQYFHNLLLNSPDGEKARSYVASRGFSAKTITDFQLGFSPNSWDALKQYLLERDYTESELLTAGLVVEAENGRTHDRFRNKLMFPILDIRGRVIGFGSRVLDDSTPKYINSPQTPTFDKSSSLYGINLAAANIRKQEMAVIVEGYMDVITAHQNGFNNVVASMGTSVTEKQVSSLKRLTRNIILAMDADVAGQEASKRGGETAIQPSDQDLKDTQDIDPNRPILSLNEGEVRKRRIFGPSYIDQNVLDTEVSIFVLPSSRDPDDIIKEDSKTWRHLVEKAVPVLDYIFDMVISKLDLTTAKDKSVALENLLPIVAQIPNSVRHAHYKQKLARLVQMSPRDLESALREMMPSPGKRKIVEREQKTVARVARSLVSNPREEYCLALLLQHPELKGNQEDPSPEYFANSENREIFITWLQTSDLSALKEKLDIAIHEHLDALVKWDLPPNHIKQKFADCKLSLKREYLTNVEAKRASSFAHEVETKGSGADLAKLKEEGIETSVQIGEIDTKRPKVVRD